MFTIIHGSHRHGYCWEITNYLYNQLKKDYDCTTIIDLSTANICFCCGSQLCQKNNCFYDQDDFSLYYKNVLLKSKGIYIVTPTYFNMPPAKLKNFIDRTNALLPIADDLTCHPFFGAYVCGEADNESINKHLVLLEDYANTMSWENVKQLNVTECIVKRPKLNEHAIKQLAVLINVELHRREG